MSANENTYILQKQDSLNSVSQNDCDSLGSADDIKGLVVEEKKEETSNLPLTGFNYVNSIIGSGIIGIPYAIHQAGFGMGIILLILFAVITDYSLCILVKAANVVGAASYQDLMRSTFGKPGFYILSFLQFFYPAVAMISYNVIIGDTVTKVFRRVFGVTTDSVLGNRHFILFLATVLVTLPLSLYRNISKLSKASFLSLIFIIIIMFFVFIRLGTFSGKLEVPEEAYSFANYGITKAIGVMAFAYMCHHNSMLLYAALENPTQQRWNKITHISLGISFILTLILGIGGYATFTTSSQGDILENYCQNDDWANVIRLLFAATIMLTYPIECFVLRQVLEVVFFQNGKQPSLTYHCCTTVGLVMAIYAFSTLTDCLGIVLEINGVVAAVPLAYMLPALITLKIEPGKFYSRQKLPPLVLFIFGVVVAVVGSALIIVHLVENGAGCSHGLEMGYCSTLENDTVLPFNMTVLNYNT